MDTLNQQDLGPRLGEDPTSVLEHCLTLVDTTGIALEFGVAGGVTLNLIAQQVPVVGFDSFTGLPEAWRPRFGKGKFACQPPEVPNAELVIGLFEDTLPAWVATNPDTRVTLVHIDCDLYSSTRTILTHLPLTPGTVVVFDEHHGYPGWEQHEARAWAEARIPHKVIGHGPEQLAVVIL